MNELGITEDFPMAALLEMGTGYEVITLAMIAEDELAGEVFQSGRDAINFIAENVSAHEVFLGLQQRGIAAGVIWSPEEMMTDPQFVERGFPVEVHHEELGRSVVYPGAPIRFTVSPMRAPVAAPHLGQHTDEVKAELAARD
jgi:crotonobetainyl-CoA:carnitine CoA-transferase CaiB-like acyl-CoA transferase